MVHGILSSSQYTSIGKLIEQVQKLLHFLILWYEVNTFLDTHGCLCAYIMLMAYIMWQTNLFWMGGENIHKHHISEFADHQARRYWNYLSQRGSYLFAVAGQTSSSVASLVLQSLAANYAGSNPKTGKERK